MMKKSFIVLVLVFALAAFYNEAAAQCSVCTRTAQQLGEKPAKGLNAGILYLAFTPLVLIGVIGFRWWRNNGAKG